LFGPSRIQAGLDIAAGVVRFEMCRTVVIATTITAIKIPAKAEKIKRVFIEATPLNLLEGLISVRGSQRVNTLSYALLD
jgi:hypothetical protein